MTSHVPDRIPCERLSRNANSPIGEKTRAGTIRLAFYCHPCPEPSQAGRCAHPQATPRAPAGHSVSAHRRTSHRPALAHARKPAPTSASRLCAFKVQTVVPYRNTWATRALPILLLTLWSGVWSDRAVARKGSSLALQGNGKRAAPVPGLRPRARCPCSSPA